METVLSYFPCNWDFSVIPEGTDMFCFFSDYAILQWGENMNFLVNNIDAFFSGIYLYQFLQFLKILPVAQNIPLFAEV